MYFQPPRFVPPLGPPKLNAKERALAAWRGRDLSALEQIGKRPAQAAQQIMPKVLEGLRLDRRRTEAELVRVWNRLIDPVITAHAQPTGIFRGTLFVTVDSSPWLNEIVRYRRQEILDRLQHSFGKDLVARISFRVG